MYRIYTEDVNRKTIHNLADARFTGYTVYTATGVWKGDQELSLVLEFAAERDWEIGKSVCDLAREIKAANHQEAVLVVQIPATHDFI
jgi:hypothetical protein